MSTGRPLDVGDHAAGGLAQRDPARVVHAVTQISIRDVRRPSAGRDPRKRQRRGHDSRSEALGEFLVRKKPNRPEPARTGERAIEVDVHEP
jgi:hypothetical protein